MVSDFELPWHVAPPHGEYESTTTIDMIAYSSLIRQRGREAERAAIISWLDWKWGAASSGCKEDTIAWIRDAIENCEHIREGEKA